MKSKLLPYLFIFVLLPNLLLAQSKQSVGWLEKIKLYPSEIIIHAKIDSGADFSSLNASNFEVFERAGKKWIKFEVSNRYGQKATIEREIIREALVKRHAGKSQKRPVIRLGICVGSRYMEADVNLADRQNFETQMLVGRSFAAGNLLIDPAMSYTLEPSCKEMHKP